MRWLKEYFRREVFPVVTPMAVNPSHPFPFLASKSLNLALLLEKNEKADDLDDDDIDVKTAIVPVPSVLPRIEMPIPATQTSMPAMAVSDIFCPKKK